MKTGIKTSGRASQSDYTWKSNDSGSADSFYDLENQVGQDHGCVIVHGDDDLFQACFAGFRTDLHDYRQRNIGVSVAFLEISQVQARALTLLFLEKYEEFSRRLLDAVERWVPTDVPPAEQGASVGEWRYDGKKLIALVEEAVKQANLAPSSSESTEANPFATPRSFDYDAKAKVGESAHTKSQRSVKMLCEELRKYDFSSGAGLKLLLASAPPQAGYEKALREADRLLWAEGSQDDLVAYRKKKQTWKTNNTLSTILAMLSRDASYRGFGTRLIKRLVLEESPNSSNHTYRVSPKKLSIICVVIAVSSILIWATRDKGDEPVSTSDTGGELESPDTPQNTDGKEESEYPKPAPDPKAEKPVPKPNDSM